LACIWRWRLEVLEPYADVELKQCIRLPGGRVHRFDRVSASAARDDAPVRNGNVANVTADVAESWTPAQMATAGDSLAARYSVKPVKPAGTAHDDGYRPVPPTRPSTCLC
jgi:hypothetical protein